ncbi:helix-turn-helix domain-containing protein [Sporosarcina contaminans]|uniref:Helix-turn-helix domain-containing protein n=1 Tax=Sporosarcina contaminans TaxID=633403 RepID=A0ABW3TVT2_9BACL
MATFADKIKKLRNDKKLSMEQLAVEFAKRYDSKISKSSISRWENGQSKPDIDDVSIYADYFNVSLDWLLNIKPNNEIETVAAHIDDDLTEEEMEDIKRYIEFIKSQRK